MYITEFCQAFVEIFSEYFPSQCKIPKLHVLRYHVIPSIQLYGSMNTETYETLHKKIFSRMLDRIRLYTSNKIKKSLLMNEMTLEILLIIDIYLQFCQIHICK